MIRIVEKEQLNEMATVCKKKDGYGMIAKVYSDDHSPAHAHLFDTNNKPLGEFELKGADAPKNPNDVVWYRTPNPPAGYAQKIVNWAKGSKLGVNNWKYALRVWDDYYGK